MTRLQQVEFGFAKEGVVTKFTSEPMTMDEAETLYFYLADRVPSANDVTIRPATQQ